LLLKPLAAEFPQFWFVMDESAELGEALDVALAVEPKVKIAAFSIFLVEMIETALVKGLKIIVPISGYEVGFGV